MKVKMKILKKIKKNEFLNHCMLNMYKSKQFVIWKYVLLNYQSTVNTDMITQLLKYVYAILSVHFCS